MCVTSKGTQLQITIASVLTVIGNVDNLKFPSSSQDLIRCMDLDDDSERLHNAGTLKGGNCSGSLYYDPADTVHQRLVSLVHSPDYVTTGLKPAERKIAWGIKLNQYTTPKTWLFTGVADKFDITAAVANPLRGDLNIAVETSTALPA